MQFSVNDYLALPDTFSISLIRHLKCIIVDMLVYLHRLLSVDIWVRKRLCYLLSLTKRYVKYRILVKTRKRRQKFLIKIND